MKLTHDEYEILLKMYNNFNEAFRALPEEYTQAFYSYLYSNGKE